MRFRLVGLVLLSACAANDASDLSGSLSLTVTQTMVAPGAMINARVTNRLRQPLTTWVELPCGSPFERLVGADWVPIGNPTQICAIGAYQATLAPDASWTYTWTAPDDSGTYRANVTIGTTHLTSHRIVVR